MRTLPQTGSASLIVGASGIVRCVANHVSVNATEYAALWAPVLPPPPTSPPVHVNVTFGHTPTLLAVETNPVFLTVLVLLMLNVTSLVGAAKLRMRYPRGLLYKKDATDLTVHPTMSGVAAHVEMAAVHLHQFALHHHCGNAEGSSVADNAQDPGAGGRVALMGPKEAEAVSALPKLSVRFEIEGDMATFNEKTFLRRLATLVGVEDVMDSAIVSTGSSSHTTIVDVEIRCPDATTLVMTAKTLKKAPGPLGLALGVRLLDSPSVTVPEPPHLRGASAAPGHGHGHGESLTHCRPASHSEVLALTIQERIPSVGGRHNSRRLLLEKKLEGASSLGTLDWQCGMAKSRTGISVTISNAPFAPPTPALEGGIQERISMSGMMTRPSRVSGSLRLRAAAATGRNEPSALMDGLSDETHRCGGLLGALGLSDSQPQELGAREAPAVREGIQERLPPMPGMRRAVTSRRATGEPRLRAQGSIAEALRSFSRSGPSQAEAPTADLTALAPSAASDAAGQPIQERVPRMTGPRTQFVQQEKAADVTPPPSPPEILPKSHVKGKTPSSTSYAKAAGSSLVVNGEKAVARATFEMRLQTKTRVLSATATQQTEVATPQTWDDRSVRDILWGTTREHTLLGCVAAFLFGDSPKLASVPQAAQLLCGSTLGLLFLSCAQLRYAWLGSTWTHVPLENNDEDDIMQRMPLLSSVGIAAALVGWPCVLIARWLFVMPNRLYPRASRAHGILMYGAVWGIVWLTCGALSVGSVSMSNRMDARVLRVDVMVSFALACAVQWFLYEPAALALFASFTLLLKWCTSFEDLPEVKANKVQQKTEQTRQKKANDTEHCNPK